MTRPIVYIASPYTRGDPAINTHFQCSVFDKLMNEGRVWPVIPLVSHFIHIMFPRPHEDWIAYDNAMIPGCDACLRLSADVEMNGKTYFERRSRGAVAEVKLFKSLGKPVFHNYDSLYEWAAGFEEKGDTNDDN